MSYLAEAGAPKLTQAPPLLLEQSNLKPRGPRKGEVMLSELVQSGILTTRTHNTEALLPELY